MNSKINSKIALEFVFFTVILLIIGWFILTYKVLFGPLIISALIAYLLYPGVTWLSKRTKIHRRHVVLIVYFLFLAFLAWALIYLAPIIVRQAKLLTRQAANLPAQMVLLESKIEEIVGFELPIDTLASDLQIDIGQMFKPDRAFRVILSATTNIIWLVVIMSVTFHLLRDWEHLREWVFDLLPEHLRPEYRQLHLEIKQVWQSYLRGQLFVMFLVGFLSGISAMALGLPNALLLGILAGVLDIIPNIGPTIATGLAALVAWVQGSSYLQISGLSIVLLVVVVFSMIQVIENFYLIPRVMGRQLNMHPGIVMVAIVGTLFTLGTLVALIIVPIIGSAGIIFGYIRRKRAGIDPWPDEEILVNNS